MPSKGCWTHMFEVHVVREAIVTRDSSSTLDETADARLSLSTTGPSLNLGAGDSTRQAQSETVRTTGPMASC